MSLGKNLSNYRKRAGLTQQQLGEHLSLSPQAISKWENDLAEPDLSTLRTLADLYKVSVDKLIAPDADISDLQEPNMEAAEEKADKKEPVGFCQTCGSIVTAETIGSQDPVIICSNCLKKRIADEKASKEMDARRAEIHRNVITSTTKTKLIKSLVVAGIVTLLFWVLSIVVFGVPGIAAGFIGSYIVFSFIACLFYDCFVNDALFEWTTKSFEFPGLIFTFDLDGVIWLIGMKLLFWILGVLLGLLAALIGISIGLITAPFVFPFIMHDVRKSITNGTESDYIDYD